MVNEIERKILGFMQLLSKENLPHIKVVMEDDRTVSIQDYSNVIVRTTQMSFDQFVSTDTKLLIQIARSMQNEKRS
jgi:CRP-like cAMP-binding protein|tara:strand:+ start:4080 stop:4307 length:228 start_codon:yes stop_codon:yes gene_type:complete